MAHDVGTAAGALSIAREALEAPPPPRFRFQGSDAAAKVAPRLSEATRKWTAAQDARTRACLGALPFRDAIRDRFEEILKVESTSYDELSLGGSTYFALKIQPPRQQPFLVAVRRPCAMRE